MRLKQIEIYGFKSFAQRTEVSFDKGITGIVGPNGSGKSNIADAVRWVLGEQSARMLRGARMEDVIFSGTQTRKALPYCEVSLEFDNLDQSLNSPFSQVLVTRRAYRSGEGEYYLNKASCRLKDILELFRDTGIGKEGYSIIGQGRIEEILSTKGDERRQVFEEAAGIVTFRVRKEEAERKLQKTVENLNRVSDILEELEGRLEPLKQQSELAQEYLALAETLRGLDLNVFLIRSDRLRERMASLKTLMEGLKEGLTLHEARLAELALEQDRIESDLEALSQEDQEARNLQSQAQEKLAAAQAELVKAQGRLDAHQQELEHLVGQQAQREEKRGQLSQLFEEGEGEAEIQRSTQREAEAALQEQERVYHDLQQKAEEAEQALDAHKQRILSALNLLSDARSQQARQQAMLGQMSKRLEELSRQEQSLQDAALEDAQALSGAQDTLSATHRDLEKQQVDFASLEAESKTAENALQAQQQRAQALLREAQVNGSRLQLLEEMARDYEGYNQAVKRALQFAGDDPAVHGVVAKLIRVPQHLETAIDMILGGTLQHIVTDDEETAKRLIDHLRNNRLGRTTFLPINSIRPRTLSQDERRHLDSPSCLGVASELIDYDGRYQGIVENILGRTVIVEDLDAAIPLSRRARQAFNVVTLAGDVMRAGGAMTGGTAQGRGSSLLGREREILDLRERLVVQEAELVEAQQAASALREQGARQARLLVEAREALSQQQIALARDQERVKNAQAQAEATDERLAAVRDAQEQLKASIEEITQDLRGVTGEAENVAVDKEQMETETLTLQHALQSARKAAESQLDLLTEARSRQSNLDHQADILRRERQRWDREMQDLRQETERAAKREEALRSQMGEAQRLLEEQEAFREQLQTALLVAQRHSQAVSGRRGETQTALKRCSDAREQCHGLLQQDSDKLHRNELVHARTENELQTLSEYILNSYELTYAGAEPFRVVGKFDLPGAEVEIKAIKSRIRDMGSVHVGAVEEYAQARERYDQLNLQKNDALRAQEDLHRLIDQLLSSMEKQFVQEFEKLNHYFAETFARLFGGGQAELILTDPSQPLTCDIDVAAQPPGKKLQLLSLLSGGERALTAIAILFAMLKLKPTPFCVLDEIEAALDEANIGYFADYLSEYAQSTQFIVITHRKGTMERCDALYGVAMEEKGVSSMVSVDLEGFH